MCLIIDDGVILLGKFNILISVVGVIYLFYSILFRNTITVYHKRDDMVVLSKEKYLKSQLNFAIGNSIFMIIVGIIAIRLDLSYTYAFLSSSLFHLINYLSRLFARKKRYIQYNQ